ncbi:MAG: RHS repeat-associated core domain-containing protein [Bacteroidia bacterium]
MTGVEHFVDGNTSNTDYLYDNSGNLKQDLNKGISSIVYNQLNKPTTITFSNGKKIQYIYDAAGTKLRQKVFGNGGSSTTVETDYVGPFHYEDGDGNGSGAIPAIQFFAHEEGRVRRAGSDLIYETFLKDHLGNVRVMFADMDGNGAVDPDPVNGEVLQVDHYYPFGLRMAGLSLVPAVKNSYLFTGKEAQDELGLGWIDFGARMYDAAASRFTTIDRFSEKYYPLTSYQYAANNPVLFVDVNGDSTWITTEGNQITINTSIEFSGRGLYKKDGTLKRSAAYNLQRIEADIKAKWEGVTYMTPEGEEKTVSVNLITTTSSSGGTEESYDQIEVLGGSGRSIITAKDREGNPIKSTDMFSLVPQIRRGENDIDISGVFYLGARTGTFAHEYGHMVGYLLEDYQQENGKTLTDMHGDPLPRIPEVRGSLMHIPSGVVKQHMLEYIFQVYPPKNN